MRNEKPLTPKTHALIDYALAVALLAVPALLKLNRKARLIYAAEAAILLPYVALTRTPVAIRGLIPLQLHRKIDPFNVAQFAGQTLLPVFHRRRKELWFNLAFTAAAGLTVLLTDWKNSGRQ